MIPTWNGYSIVTDDDDTGGTEWQPRLDGTKLHYKCNAVYDQGSAAASGASNSSVRYVFADHDTGLKIAYCRNGQWIPPLIPCIGRLHARADLLFKPALANLACRPAEENS